MKRSKRYYLSQKHKAYELLGKACKRCGFSDWRALQIDHINGKGETTGFQTYKEVIKDPSKFQLLCANCNWIKRHENKEGYQILNPYTIIKEEIKQLKESNEISSEVSAWIDTLDIPKIMVEAVKSNKRQREVTCFNCQSKNLKKMPKLYIRGTPAHSLLIYICNECGFKGTYKWVCAESREII